MLILAFDTATPAGSVALVDEEKVLLERYFDGKIRHTQRLFIEIDEVFEIAEKGIDEIDAVAVSIGPGSFTGLRIGLSAAKGICLALNKPLVAVSTLEVLAARLPFARYPVCPVLDARKQEVYAALYDNTEGTPKLISPPRALAPDALLRERSGEPTIYTGDGIAACWELIEGSGSQAFVAPSRCARPEAGVLGGLTVERLRAGEVADLSSVEPEYIRAPDARITP